MIIMYVEEMNKCGRNEKHNLKHILPKLGKCTQTSYFNK
jgi:hypothetical protein